MEFVGAWMFTKLCELMQQMRKNELIEQNNQEDCPKDYAECFDKQMRILLLIFLILNNSLLNQIRLEMRNNSENNSNQYKSQNTE